MFPLLAWDATNQRDQIYSNIWTIIGYYYVSYLNMGYQKSNQSNHSNTFELIVGYNNALTWIQKNKVIQAILIVHYYKSNIDINRFK